MKRTRNGGGGEQKGTSANCIKQRSPRSYSLLAWPVLSGSAYASALVRCFGQWLMFPSVRAFGIVLQCRLCKYPAVPGNGEKTRLQAPVSPLVRLVSRSHDELVTWCAYLLVRMPVSVLPVRLLAVGLSLLSSLLTRLFPAVKFRVAKKNIPCIPRGRNRRDGKWGNRMLFCQH